MTKSRMGYILSDAGGILGDIAANSFRVMVSIMFDQNVSSRGQILIVEDDFFTAHGALTILEMLGFDAIGPAASIQHAVDLIADTMPLAAILDIELGLQFVFPLADILVSKQVPFGFVAGDALRSHIPERHHGRPVALKPYGIDHIEQLLVDLGCLGLVTDRP